MRKISADYIFSVAAPPIKNGIIILDDEGTILDLVIPDSTVKLSEDVEHYEGIICPGFVNTHCHLELSHLKGKLQEEKGLDEFIKEIENIRKASEKEITEAIVKAEDEMLANGIVAVGDISNGNLSFKQKAKQRLKYHSFIELFAFDPGRADNTFEKGLLLLRDYLLLHQPANPAVSITPHAPYSASDKLLTKISSFAEKNNSILSIHNQESTEEDLLFKKKEGKILKRLEHFGIDVSLWNPTGFSSLQSTLKYLPKNRKILLVHNTYTSREDIQWAHHYSKYIYWCFCPNANLYIENKLPPIKEFINENAKITIGTDSLASNHSLSILDELKTISNHYPGIDLNTLLTWATRNGAEFFGFDNELGTIEKGKRPGLNLIKNTDGLHLCKKSTVERLI